MSLLGVIESTASAVEEAIAESRGQEAAAVLPELERVGENIGADARRIADLATGADIDPLPESPCEGAGKIRAVIAHLVSCAECGSEWGAYGYDAARIPPHTSALV